jgi:hypothetical protein
LALGTRTKLKYSIASPVTVEVTLKWLRGAKYCFGIVSGKPYFFNCVPQTGEFFPVLLCRPK